MEKGGFNVELTTIDIDIDNFQLILLDLNWDHEKISNIRCFSFDISFIIKYKE